MKILLLIIISSIVFLIIESIRKRKGSRETSRENKETSRGENSTYKNTFAWQDYHLPNGAESLISMFSKIVKADGVITKEEIDLVDEFFHNVLNLSDKQRKLAIEIFNKEKISDNTFEYHCRQFGKKINWDTKMLKFAIDYLFLLAYIDNKFSVEEEILINEAISIFGVRGTRYNQYKKKSEEQKKYSDSINSEAIYYEFLGINQNSSFDDIKRKYRDLASKYHPDKFNHLGEDFVKIAEDQMRKINEAYEYFKNKYAQ